MYNNYYVLITILLVYSMYITAVSIFKRVKKIQVHFSSIVIIKMKSFLVLSVLVASITVVLGAPNNNGIALLLV